MYVGTRLLTFEKKLIGEKLLDYKLDGVRVLAIYDAEADPSYNVSVTVSSSTILDTLKKK